MARSSYTISRRASLSYHENTCVGVCIFVSRKELRKLGVSVDETEQIEYNIKSNNKCISISEASIELEHG